MRQSKMLTLSILASLVMTSACRRNDQPKTVVPTNTDRFLNDSMEYYTQASQVLRADYMFVVDYSYSMNSKVTQLMNSMGGFADNLRAEDIDYRIGVVRGNFHGTAGSNSSLILAWTPSAFIAPFLTPGTSPSLETQLISQMGAVGQPLQQNRTVILEAAVKTLQAQAGSFLRPDAQLVTVFVSDTDDSSNVAPQSTAYGHDTSESWYVNQIKSFKLPGYVNARAIVAGMDGCTIPNAYDKAGIRLRNVAKNLDAASPNAACIYNTFSENLSLLARNVTRPTDRFRLMSTPVPGTVTVRVNGIPVPAAGNWSFDSASNQVIFIAGQEPGPSDSVELDYEIRFTLSQIPRAETIKVESNGVLVPNDASNGWTYISAENRIAFHGSWTPNEGTDVRVTYEVQ